MCPLPLLLTLSIAKVQVERLDDPITPVQEILKRVPVRHLMKIYNVPAFTSHLHFLSAVAKARGRLRPGGTPDLESAARMVLQVSRGDA